MSWPTRAKCYEEISEDPTLLQLFLLEEYSSVQELPCVGTLWFRFISEGFFTHVAFPNNWGNFSPNLVWRWVRKPPIQQSSLPMGYEMGIWIWWQFSATLIRPKWRPMMPSLPYTNMTHQSQGWWWWEDTLTLPTSLKGCPIHFIWMWALSQGALPLPNFH